MNALKDIPTHVWLFACCAILLGLYYVRPDPVTIDLVKAFTGALLLSFKPHEPSPDK